uniref:Peptidase metallopeptidase domain-containing protein n=1 Tax=Astyanax mexicanus TaxID=7994 RepID=A0A8B9H7Q5_ASTMX
MFKYLFLFNLQVYLTKYGYLPTSLHHPKDQDGQVKQISEALRVFQKVMELPVSGRLDNATLVMMKQPRCGLKDPFNNRTLKYRVLGHWRKKTLSYRIYNHASSLGVAKTRAAIQTAFRYWSEVSPLRFHELNKGHPDIKISFHGRDRVCPVPFDGPGERRTGLIAFTFLLNFPPFGSGKPVEKPPPAPAVPNKPPADSAAPNPCTASLDAIMLGPLHKTFAFSGDYVWTISDAGYNTPIRINVLWKDLPGHINAAVHSPRTSKSYFLKGEKVWRYSGFKLDHGYPKVLLIPPNIDSAFYSNANKKLIFIKVKHYRNHKTIPSTPSQVQLCYRQISQSLIPPPNDVQSSVSHCFHKHTAAAANQPISSTSCSASKPIHHPVPLPKYPSNFLAFFKFELRVE